MQKHAQRKMPVPRKLGFTLIELLVVVSIIALLVSILMPALGRARSQAKALLCATQQKDIGTAMSLYMSDWNGNMPPSGPLSKEEEEKVGLPNTRWFVRIGEYYQKDRLEMYDWELVRCPTSHELLERNPDWVEESSSDMGGAAGTYLYNQWFCGTEVHWLDKYQYWKNASSLRSPSELPLIACCNPSDPVDGLHGHSGWRMILGGPHAIAGDYGYMDGDETALRYTTNRYGPAPNHEGKTNFLYLDMHVERQWICTLGKWPWLGQTQEEQLKADQVFKPRR